MREIGSQTHQATKSNINRLVTSFEPFYKRFRRFIIRCKIKEAKSHNINLRSPICRPANKTTSRYHMLASKFMSAHVARIVHNM
jgi:hypothetical protein